MMFIFCSVVVRCLFCTVRGGICPMIMYPLPYLKGEFSGNGVFTLYVLYVYMWDVVAVCMCLSMAV